MFKFIIRHLSDRTRPIAALFKKQQQKGNRWGSSFGFAHPLPLGRTTSNFSALLFGALVACVWNFEKHWKSSEIENMQKLR